MRYSPFTKEPTLESERRLAAILSADVVGYSRLMADDEEATVRTIGVYREQVATLIREHRGRLVDFSGDNFLAEFSAARDAVESAIEIQRVLGARNAGLAADRRMDFRIGIHLGDVRVEGERIFGDGVNIAARLESLAEPGGMCISATVHDQVRNRLAVDFDDLGDQAVKNIPDQVHVYRVNVRGGGRTPTAIAPPQAEAQARAEGGGRARWVVAAALAAVLGIAFVVWPRVNLMLEARAIGSGGNLAIPEKPSIVVLPFTNLSGDPEQEYFSDGMTEDLTTALSGVSNMFVISRNSAFTYKGHAVKVEDVGRELGVRYVLEGSVRRAGDQVRITAQLIDATTGFHVWSEKYDRKLEDVFQLQSEISERILAAVGASISAAELERIRRKPTDDLTAYDAHARGMYHFSRYRRDDLLEARRLFERAVELDPGYAAAISMIGSTYSAGYGMLFELDPGNLDRAREYAERARELDPSIPGPWVLQGTIALNEGRMETALTDFETAHRLAPSEPQPLAFKAAVLQRIGRANEAIEFVRAAMRLNPRNNQNQALSALLAVIYLRTGREAEAIALWETARDSNPDLIPPRLALANQYAMRGRDAEARAIVAEVLAINPDLTSRDLVEGTRTMLLGGNDPVARLQSVGLP